MLHTSSFMSHNIQGIAIATTAFVGSPTRIQMGVATIESPSRGLSHRSKVRVLNIGLSSTWRKVVCHEPSAPALEFASSRCFCCTWLLRATWALPFHETMEARFSLLVYSHGY